MKQSSFKPQHVLRTLALVAGVLGVAFVAAPPVAEAQGLPLPHEIIRDHLRRVSHFIDHSVRFPDGDRRYDDRRYPGHVRYPRYDRPFHGHPGVAGGYAPYRSYHGGGYISGYIGIPSGRAYRDEDCHRYDDRYRGDNRYRYDDRGRNHDHEGND